MCGHDCDKERKTICELHKFRYVQRNDDYQPWKTIPHINDFLTKEIFTYVQSTSKFNEFILVPSCPAIHR
jgi:hypothetical protein